MWARKSGLLSMALPAYYAARSGAGAIGGHCFTPRIRRGTSRMSSSARRLIPTPTAYALIGTLLAFFFAVGVGAHALDELHGLAAAHHDSDRMGRRARSRRSADRGQRAASPA